MKLSHGSGSYLWMEGDEQPYLDFIMAYGSTNFGHAHPKIVHAVQKAASLVDNTSPYGYTPRRELTQSLVDQLPYAVEAHQIHCIEGGARAVEAAIEMTRIISGRRKVISFVGAFHGYATSVIGISDLAFFSGAYAKYENHENIQLYFPETDAEVDGTIAALETALASRHDVACVLLETAQGMAGFRMAPRRFFTKLQQIVTGTKTLLIVDDILMGMGRVGSLYSFSPYSLHPDLIILGKSLAGGYYPLSAIIGDENLFSGAGIACTGLDSTFADNHFGIYIANEIQKIIVEDKIYEQVQSTTVVFKAMIAELVKKYPGHIKSMSCWGMAGSVTLESADVAYKIMELCMHEHLIIQFSGVHKNYLRFTPSLLSTPEEIAAAHAVLDKVFSEVFAS